MSIGMRLAQNLGSDYGFSMDPKRTADALRRLADDIEANEVLLQKVVQYRTASAENYEMAGVVMSWAEKEKEPHAQA